MAAMDNKDYTYICESCGKKAVPIEFSSEDLDSPGGQDEEGGDFLRIPIVPLNTSALLSIGSFDLPLGKIAQVVDIRWGDNEFRIADYRADFLDYWRAVSGKRYNSSEIMLMDLAGIREARPNFKVLKKLIKSRYNIWLDLGMRDIQDLFDSFAMDISWAVAGTITCSSIDLYREIFELSPRCLPLLYYDREVMWYRKGAGPEEVLGALEELRGLGYSTAAVLDLPRLGTGDGPSEELLEELQKVDMEVMLGGGITEKDQEVLEERGFSGALMDPYTPVIRNIIDDREREEPVDHSLESPSGAPRPDALPSD